MYYERSRAGAGMAHEPADEGNKPHSRQQSGDSGDSAKSLPKRSNWAWAAAREHYAWMEVHSPFSTYD